MNYHWATLACVFTAGIALGHEVNVHSSITGRAVFSSENIASFARDNFGTEDISSIEFTYNSQTRPIHSWIMYGSMQEDLMNPTLGISFLQRRVLNHFYNPLGIPRSLNDNSEGPLPAIWFNPIDSFIWGSDHPANTESWTNARGYEWYALTSSLKTVRDANWGHMFKALGHVLHLNQDLSQPDHARNDNHYSKRYIEDYGTRTFVYELIKSPSNGGVPFSTLTWDGWRSAGFHKLEDFWNRDSYNGQANVLVADANSIQPTLGLAEFSNGNFLGEDSLYPEVTGVLPQHRFPYPSIETSTNYRQVRKNPASGANYELFRDKISRKRVFLKKSGDGVKMTNHAVLSYLDVKLGSLFNSTWTYQYGVSIQSDNVLQDYHSILIPKAVEYSAAILDYFFRGRISATVLGDTLTVRNDSGEPFGIGGTFTVLVEDSGGNRETVGSPVTLTEILPDGDTQEIALPGTVESGDKCIVVYKGTIGLTDNAPSDPVDAGIAIAATHIIIPLDCTELDLDDAEFLGTQTISDVSQESYDSFGTFAAGTYMVKYTNGTYSFAGSLEAWTGINGSGHVPAITVDYKYNGSTAAIFSETGEFYYDPVAAEEHFAGAKVCFQHTGGEIRLHFTDSYYPDNSGGSTNPTFELYRLSPP